MTLAYIGVLKSAAGEEIERYRLGYVSQRTAKQSLNEMCHYSPPDSPRLCAENTMELCGVVGTVAGPMLQDISERPADRAHWHDKGWAPNFP